MPSDPRIDAYIATRAAFARPLLAWLRERVHAACPEAEETIKWGAPAFTYKQRPLAAMAAFQRHASFGLHDRAALATGREGEAMGQYGRVASLADLPDAAAVERHIAAAVALIDAGTRAQRPASAAPPVAEPPAALAAALAGDPAAAATFAGFPPSARRDYCAWIAGAKRAETRDKRVAEAIAWLRAGKRRHWKYESC